jgi:hypothetical protein
VACGDLQPGDLLSSHDGGWIPVAEVYDTGECEGVYNLRVARYHTYFVGGQEWGFSVWVHNECVGIPERPETGEAWQSKIKGTQIIDLTRPGWTVSPKWEDRENDVAYYLVNKKTGQIMKPGDSSVSGFVGRMATHKTDLKNRFDVTDTIVVAYEVERGSRGEVENGLRQFLLGRGQSLPADNEGKRRMHKEAGLAEGVWQKEDPNAERVTFPFYIFGQLVEK